LATALLPLLHNPEVEIRRTAALSLGKLAVVDAVPGLITALRDPDALVRQYAAKALGAMGDTAQLLTADALLTSLTDLDPAVRSAAVQALGSVGVPQTLSERLTALLASHHPASERAATRVVALLDTPPTGLDIFPLLKSADAPVRQAAITALAENSDTGIRLPSILQEMVQVDPDAGVRSEAAYRLGKMGGAESIASLTLAAEHDPSPVVQAWARWALHQLQEGRS
jgi:HEAT repeat protein